MKILLREIHYGPGLPHIKNDVVITGYKKLVILSFDPVCLLSYTKGIEEVQLTMLYQLILKLL